MSSTRGIADSARNQCLPALVSEIGSDQFRHVMGHFLSGVTIVSGGEPPIRAGFTCQAVMSVSLMPPLVAICPGVASTSWPHIARGRKFCINVLGEQHGGLARRFSASGTDKFVGVDTQWGEDGILRISDCLAWIGCEMYQSQLCGDHWLIVGRVRSLRCNPGSPLGFYRGEFQSLRSSGSSESE